MRHRGCEILHVVQPEGRVDVCVADPHAHHARTVREAQRAGVRGAVVGLEPRNDARAEELE